MTAGESTQRFVERLPVLAALGSHVVESIKAAVFARLASGDQKGFFQIEPSFRVKVPESFREKITRKGKNYDDPLSQITDQVGARFVVLLSKHAKLVNDVIGTMPGWIIDRARDIEKEREENPHHFDYVSDHWVVNLSEPQKFGEVTVTPDIPCEIQVRTLLQHAYAELAHSTVYKPNLTARAEVRRAIAKGAALVETTDGVFGEVSDKIESHTNEIAAPLVPATEWYRSNIGIPEDTSANRVRTLRVLDSYQAELRMCNANELKQFLSSRGWMATWLASDEELDSLFRHPVILLVVWLVVELEQDIARKWPLDLELLRPIFAKLGIATVGALD